MMLVLFIICFNKTKFLAFKIKLPKSDKQINVFLSTTEFNKNIPVTKKATRIQNVKDVLRLLNKKEKQL